MSKTNEIVWGPGSGHLTTNRNGREVSITVERFGPDRYESARVLRLYESAPDLLAALRELLLHVGGLSGADLSLPLTWEEALRASRAAVAKAEGGAR